MSEMRVWKGVGVGLLVAAVLAALPDLSAQTAPNAEMREPATPPPAQSRLAAGIREYPTPVLRALFTLVDSPPALRQLLDAPDKLQNPETLTPPASPELLAALRELQAVPLVLEIAAAHPQELRALRDLYRAAPEGMEQRVFELRAGYEAAALEAAAAWRKTLEAQPGLLREYRDLVTRYCEERRAARADLPCVRVLNPDYYYACPPNEIFMDSVLKYGPSPAFREALERWWGDNLPARQDARAARRGQARPGILPQTPADLSREARLAYWTPADAGAGETAGLVPIMLQPLADQPPAARLEYAAVEHARLWSASGAPEIPADGGPPPVAQAPPPPQVLEEAEREFRYGDPPTYAGVTTYRDVAWGPSGTYFGYSAGGYVPNLYPYSSIYPYGGPIVAGYRSCPPRYYGYYNSSGVSLSAWYRADNFDVCFQSRPYGNGNCDSYGYYDSGNCGQRAAYDSGGPSRIGRSRYYPSAQRQLRAYETSAAPPTVGQPLASPRTTRGDAARLTERSRPGANSNPIYGNPGRTWGSPPPGAQNTAPRSSAAGARNAPPRAAQSYSSPRSNRSQAGVSNPGRNGMSSPQPAIRSSSPPPSNQNKPARPPASGGNRRP